MKGLNISDIHLYHLQSFQKMKSSTHALLHQGLQQFGYGLGFLNIGGIDLDSAFSGVDKREKTQNVTDFY